MAVTATRRSGAKGFTLIELMTTTFVAAILLTIATPYFRDFVLGQRTKTAAYDLASSLVYARSEAIKRNTSVTVAPATGGWQNGWSVLAGASVLSAHEAFPGLAVTGPVGGLVYNSSGRLAAAANPFSISATNSTATSQCVNVDLSGQPTSQMGSC
jgi:type IV fimbrial biogenesis protein FimT